ncbi:hypothetical protein PanWU01x14_043890 [Parasponia andersonii]|uniref:Uncharacterized protein n=1 Tax=Parasponia andersonii TaxID=3476 RepID=A0A2P5DP26_PARAD|nr:hypothetical protein PanWU01x14_043890 [Parasponia andersonii]
MKRIASLNDEKDDLINLFVQKGKAFGRHSLYAENKAYLYKENHASLNGESIPKNWFGDVVMKWIENHLEIERIAINELHKRQTIFENKVLSELQSMDDKLSRIQSMNNNHGDYKEDDGAEVISPYPWPV